MIESPPIPYILDMGLHGTKQTSAATAAVSYFSFTIRVGLCRHGEAFALSVHGEPPVETIHE